MRMSTRDMIGVDITAATLSEHGNNILTERRVHAADSISWIIGADTGMCHRNHRMRRMLKEDGERFFRLFTHLEDIHPRDDFLRKGITIAIMGNLHWRTATMQGNRDLVGHGLFCRLKD
jgi:hypothetical protein